jgi:hypothetical protein
MIALLEARNGISPTTAYRIAVPPDISDQRRQAIEQHSKKGSLNFSYMSAPKKG